MPTGHLRTNKRRPKDAERMRIAMEMQRPGKNLRCGSSVVEDGSKHERLGRSELEMSKCLTDAGSTPARTAHEIEGVPI